MYRTCEEEEANREMWFDDGKGREGRVECKYEIVNTMHTSACVRVCK